MIQILKLYQFFLLLSWETIANIDSKSTFCYEHYNQLNQEWLEHKSLCLKGDETPCCEDKTYSMNRRWKEFHMLCPHLGKSCSDLYKEGVRADGIYSVYIHGYGRFNVRCDMSTDDGGWTIFQRRMDGSVDFYRNWIDYKNGFGNLSGEFWLGLDKLHVLTKNGENVLRVDLEDFEDETGYAKYNEFSVSNEGDKYQLKVGRYSGSAGDSLAWHNGMRFTTKDDDNDKNSGYNCAKLYKGAWWYNYCHNSNLNGLYLRGRHTEYAKGVNWYHWRGHHYSLKKTELKVRPRHFSHLVYLC